MGSFLTTRKMAPALAARVEASVRGAPGKAKPPGELGESRWAPRIVSVVRLGAILAIAGAITFVVLARRQEKRDFERARDALLDTVRSESAALTPEDRGAVARVESWLARFSGGYDGDFVADELKAPGALAALLTRSSVYARGPLGAFHNPVTASEAAAASLKDPLAVCMVDPPSGRSEKVLLEKVRAAYSRAAEQHTPNMRRLHEAIIGLPFLLPPWADGVREAQTSDEIDALRRDLERAPIEGATRAAKAELLLLAIDEPGEPGGPTELDGERMHEVRLGLVALAPGKVLLRMRKRVDPSWISSAKRPEYAGALDGCKMAFDVYESVGADVLTAKGDSRAATSRGTPTAR